MIDAPIDCCSASLDPAIATVDPVTGVVTGVAVTCPDRTGRPLRHSAQIRPDTEDWAKQDLVRTNCSWRAERWRTPG